MNVSNFEADKPISLEAEWMKPPVQNNKKDCLQYDSLQQSRTVLAKEDYHDTQLVCT